LKHVTTNFDFYKLINDNKEAKEDFNAMLFGMVKEIFNTRCSSFFYLKGVEKQLTLRRKTAWSSGISATS